MNQAVMKDLLELRENCVNASCLVSASMVDCMDMQIAEIQELIVQAEEQILKYKASIA